MSAVKMNERRFIERGLVAREAGDTGWGLFADEDMEPGSYVFVLKPEDSARSSVVRWEEAFGPCHDRGYTFLPGFSFCCTPELPFWYVNHSCDPNAGFVNWGRLEADGIPMVAHRRIAKGEEITADYSLMTTGYDGSPEGDAWDMAPCRCGRPHCRGKITAFDVLDRDLQLKAILPDNHVRGRVLAHVLKERPDMVELVRQQDPAMYEKYLDALKQQDMLVDKLKKDGHL